MDPVGKAGVAAPDPKDAIERKKRLEAVRGFEEMFLAQMLKSMRKTVPEGEGQSEARRMWQDRFDGEIARRIAESGGIGLGPLIDRGVAQGQRGKGGSGGAGNP